MRYRIVVGGDLDPQVAALLGDLEVRRGETRTELVGEVVDQSALVGLISRLTSLELEVISVVPLGH